MTAPPIEEVPSHLCATCGYSWAMHHPEDGDCPAMTDDGGVNRQAYGDEPDPPAPDPYGRPDPRTHPEFWTE